MMGDISSQSQFTANEAALFDGARTGECLEGWKDLCECEDPFIFCKMDQHFYSMCGKIFLPDFSTILGNMATG